MRKTVLTLLVLVFCCTMANAQFRNTRGVTAENNTSAVAGPPGSEVGTASSADSISVATDTLQGFSLKRLVRGYARKDTLTPSYLVLGSAVLPGASQIYNRQYWKVPLTYAGIGAGIYGGIYFNRQYQQSGDSKYKLYRAASYIGAGAVYWGHLLDGIANFKTDLPSPVPAKSTLYSVLLPGLGQACNGDWWKIPIWYGGFIACGYFYHLNDMEYQRFKYICNADSNREKYGYIGSITKDQAQWYRDSYRRYRDYSILAFLLVYALNVIDANVFAYMADFDVSDNIAQLEIQPAVIPPITTEFAFNAPAQPAFGLNLQFSF